MNARNLDRQRGQILPMVAITMTLLFVPLSIFVIDSGLVMASYAQLGETLTASAEAGASTIDQTIFRQSGGQRVVLDPAAASATSDRSLAASGMPGLGTWTVSVQGNTVTVSATTRVRLFAVGAVDLHQTRSASFVYGG
jgi:hypothetical protein